MAFEDRSMEDFLENPSAYLRELRRSLIDELVKLLGLSPSGLPRHLLNPVLFPTANAFAKIASSFDRIVEQAGFRDAAGWALSHFANKVDVLGLEHIPQEGPLLVVSNHPGSVDALAIASQLPRQDLKIVVSGIPFVQKLRSAAEHIIFATSDAHERMAAVRSIIRQLEAGGSLLIFPTGTVDPDPAIMPGASEALRQWSPSLEIILRRVPETNLLVTIVSGVLSPRFLQNPLTRIRKGIRDRQKMAEFLQIAQQLFLPRSLTLVPQISFAEPITPGQLVEPDPSCGILPRVIARAQELLVQHCELAFRR